MIWCHIDASHIFPEHIDVGRVSGAACCCANIMYEFLQLLAPHLNRRLVDRAHVAPGPLEVEQLFGDIELPLR